MEKENRIGAYVFEEESQYKRAKKESDIIEYVKQHSDMENSELVRHIYDQALDKNTFQTAAGYAFMAELRQLLLESGTVSEEELRPIIIKGQGRQKAPTKDALEAKQYKDLYEKEKTGKRCYWIVIGFLAAIIAGMLLMAQFTPNSIFTNYRQKIENDYEAWQADLEQKEAQLREREEQLKKSEN